jgi:hypothetical protein
MTSSSVKQRHPAYHLCSLCHEAKGGSDAIASRMRMSKHPRIDFSPGRGKRSREKEQEDG